MLQTVLRLPSGLALTLTTLTVSGSHHTLTAMATPAQASQEAKAVAVQGWQAAPDKALNLELNHPPLGLLLAPSF